ncbi:MAG: branched-chain amino acid ABC transporter permease [Treponema porcinum]|uniref:branched-chain amino acid ABC transporter permease n=1 Tax=Treponema porcinum TaxID=261392 RepID=UPI0023545AB4|nr:branched-chain amino acid ABC transporter permease [Treponema porcinum]MCI5645519.1 branched-chain amino acid ABC transporter permease [Treponema porcinum]MCI6179364.1 branched-chain amino acid ABC transporter permease [Treponema porcinum]MCI6322539.1 branched-chain amino acid ABC transporter permease [Treponema porcinum]MCI6722375.1 branched-chain amino acid ABC transporter permease [Treponema porcinum]MCI6816110.1 branched-chain amino acid ABC transporter permease [Treponema porcinum]
MLFLYAGQNSGFLSEFLQQLINGLSLGSIYALIALGYTMVYGIVKLINFAHGDVMMMGAYAGYFVLMCLGATVPGLAGAFIAAMVLCGLLAILIERFAYRPLRSAPRLNSLITAIAVELILQNLMRILPFVGPNPRPFPTMPVHNFTFNVVSVSSTTLIVIITSAVLMILLNFIVNHTKTGKAMQAVSYDLQASALMGINVNRIIAVTFLIGSILAGAGGVLYATAYPLIDPMMGYIPGLKAFVAAVLGGIGSIPGAMAGGIILGIAETLTKGYLSSQYADAISYGILIVILLIKPTGLFGKKTSVKV